MSQRMGLDPMAMIWSSVATLPSTNLALLERKAEPEFRAKFAISDVTADPPQEG